MTHALFIGNQTACERLDPSIFSFFQRKVRILLSEAYGNECALMTPLCALCISTSAQVVGSIATTNRSRQPRSWSALIRRFQVWRWTCHLLDCFVVFLFHLAGREGNIMIVERNDVVTSVSVTRKF